MSRAFDLGLEGKLVNQPVVCLHQGCVTRVMVDELHLDVSLNKLGGIARP